MSPRHLTVATYHVAVSSFLAQHARPILRYSYGVPPLAAATGAYLLRSLP